MNHTVTRIAAPLSAMLLSVFSAGCASAPNLQPPQLAQSNFYSRLAELEGQTFAGETAFMADPAPPFDGAALGMNVESVDRGVMRIRFLVDGEPGRTWILRRTADGLLLKHEHREPDGSISEITNYGGWAHADGTSLRQSFPADAETARLIPEARTNVWTLEFVPSESLFIYDLRRHGRPRFRAEFDLREPVEQ